MKKITVIAAMFIATLVFINQAVAAEFLITKKGETVTVYEIYNYGESDMSYDVNILTNPTVAALQNLSVPESAFAMCGRYNDGVFSTQLNAANAMIENDRVALDNNKENIEWLTDSRATYKILFWITLIVLSVAIFILSELGQYQKKEPPVITRKKNNHKN